MTGRAQVVYVHEENRRVTNNLTEKKRERRVGSERALPPPSIKRMKTASTWEQRQGEDGSWSMWHECAEGRWQAKVVRRPGERTVCAAKRFRGQEAIVAGYGGAGEEEGIATRGGRKAMAIREVLEGERPNVHVARTGTVVAKEEIEEGEELRRAVAERVVVARVEVDTDTGTRGEVECGEAEQEEPNGTVGGNGGWEGADGTHAEMVLQEGDEVHAGLEEEKQGVTHRTQDERREEGREGLEGNREGENVGGGGGMKKE